jgi:hypothetical protein
MNETFSILHEASSLLIFNLNSLRYRTFATSEITTVLFYNKFNLLNEQKILLNEKLQFTNFALPKSTNFGEDVAEYIALF